MTIDCGRPFDVAGLAVRALSLSSPLVNACSAIDCALPLVVCGSSIAGTLAAGGEVLNDPPDLLLGMVYPVSSSGIVGGATGIAGMDGMALRAPGPARTIDQSSSSHLHSAMRFTLPFGSALVG